MRLIFQKIRYKNFLAFGNTITEIDFTKSKKTLLYGVNGVGKSSSVLDPLTFVLFGKPYRKINKGNVVNSINKKDCLVEVEFISANKQYKVVRGIKPNLFEIYENGVILNKDSANKDYQEILETSILKTNFKSFTQIVILGSARYTPFMLLSSGDRRTVIEDLLDLQIFSAMNVIAKDKLNKIKTEITDSIYQHDILKEKIKTQQYLIRQSKKKTSEEIEAKEETISSYELEIEQLNSKILELTTNITLLTEKTAEISSIKQKKNKYIEVQTKAISNKTRYAKILSFYTENDNCPTCKQRIEQEFKQIKINEYEKKLNDLNEGYKKLEQQLEDVNTKMSEYENVLLEINGIKSKISDCSITIKNYNSFIKNIREEISELKSFKVDKQVVKLLEDYKIEYTILNDKLHSLREDKKYLEYSVNLLKDGGIKTKIIKKYLPILNKLINTYLSKLDFFVNFNINENFEEEIKSRYRDSYQYTNFSEGEKTKIDLALMLAFRELAKMKNGIYCNLLLMDEILDSSLDENSINLFLDLLDAFDNNTNIFIISHRSDEIKDRFDRIIKFEKVKNFSKARVMYE